MAISTVAICALLAAGAPTGATPTEAPLPRQQLAAPAQAKWQATQQKHRQPALRHVKLGDKIRRREGGAHRTKRNHR